MMAFLGTVFVGLIVGLLARAIKPGDDKMGWIMTIILGVLGALLAGYMGRAMGFYRAGEPVGWIASIIGAIVLLFIYDAVRRKR
ncbi:GlsB/YeaQ/YmgE family stress response membrane protein [Cupriavidus pauculus]|uniref:GlsB/YeaQ/YmgE family stress response membrane protein n=1 Tax=Cupriavidus pauculus TaxID=82633 RepID=A0A2N5C4K2_9BURK|nr:GlsB/YeaQ/YmgE family stress response membrane protein [Cupriavidus pauculus]PLP97136.1 GlsB/YeaQ/YmgE family stress response membrane protein [Cupriavidus pauculus]